MQTQSSSCHTFNKSTSLTESMVVSGVRPPSASYITSIICFTHPLEAINRFFFISLLVIYGSSKFKDSVEISSDCACKRVAPCVLPQTCWVTEYQLVFVAKRVTGLFFSVYRTVFFVGLYLWGGNMDSKRAFLSKVNVSTVWDNKNKFSLELLHYFYSQERIPV